MYPKPRRVRSADDVIAVVEEGLANAFRHGDATEVRVAIGPHAGSLRVEIADNGIGPSGDGAGLGSEVIREFSGGRATLERLSGTTTLVVDLPPS